MPDVAISQGLVVNHTIDERSNPIKNINASVKELEADGNRLGDPLLALQEYNTGYGRVLGMISAFSKGAISDDPVQESTAHVKDYLGKRHVAFYQLLNDPDVNTWMKSKNLNPEAWYYVNQAIAAGLLWKGLFQYRKNGKADQEYLDFVSGAKNDPQKKSELLTYVGLS